MHVLKKSEIVYKKGAKGRIVVMRLVKGTRINKAITYDGKNRADKVTVLAVTNAKGDKFFLSALPLMNSHRDGTVYKVGAVVKPQFPYAEHNGECSSGIHFFASRQRTVDYN